MLSFCPSYDPPLHGGATNGLKSMTYPHWLIAACARVWSRLRHHGARYIKLENVEVLEMGDGLISDYSTYKITDSRGKQIDNGK